MARTSFLLTALVVGAAATACANGGKRGHSDSSQARELLMKILDRNYRNNIIAIISQRSPDGRGSYQRIQVQISKDGKVRQTVIYPLSLQGVEKVDDGRQSAVFLPDEKLVLVEESPRTLPDDSQTRINLTVRNYGLSVVGNTTIAGQRAAIVVAKPRHAGLESRRYHIDEKTGFILKLETLDAKGTPKLAFQVQQVTYPTNISSSVFSIGLDKKEEYSVISQRRTGFLDGGGKGYVPIGFSPVFPAELPYGFDIQDAQVNDNGYYRCVAIRISDGPIKGTVYQYAQSYARSLKNMTGTSVGDAGGIRFVVAADVPENVRKRILSAFLEATKKADQDNPGLGLFWGEELLPEKLSLTATEEWTLEIRQWSQVLLITHQ